MALGRIWQSPDEEKANGEAQSTRRAAEKSTGKSTGKSACATKKQAAHLKVLVRGFGSAEVEGHLVGDADAVAFQGDNFLGVIGHHADIF